MIAMASNAALIAKGAPEYSDEWRGIFEGAGLNCLIVTSLGEARQVLATPERWLYTVIDEELSDGTGFDLLPKGVTRSGAYPPLVSVADALDTSSLAEAYVGSAVPVPRTLVAKTLIEVLRRHRETSDASMEVTLRAGERAVESREGVGLLSTGEWRILNRLVSHRGGWVSATELASQEFERRDPAGVALVWKYVSRMRKALAFVPDLIERVPGQGYRLNPEVEVRVWTESSDGPARPSEPLRVGDAKRVDGSAK